MARGPLPPTWISSNTTGMPSAGGAVPAKSRTWKNTSAGVSALRMKPKPRGPFQRLIWPCLRIA